MRARFERFLLVVERLGNSADDVVRHRGVDLCGELDEPRVLPVLPRLPRQVKRIDRNAVSAQARAQDRTA